MRDPISPLPNGLGATCEIHLPAMAGINRFAGKIARYHRLAGQGRRKQPAGENTEFRPHIRNQAPHRLPSGLTFAG
jgi:hypothetical protein